MDTTSKNKATIFFIAFVMILFIIKLSKIHKVIEFYLLKFLKLIQLHNLISGRQKNLMYIYYKMRIVIQLIQNYLKQEVPSLLITTDNNQYLFNVPSSYQRFTKEHKTKMPGGAYFFFTKSNTATVTGLTGLLLTLFDGGQSCKSKLYTDDKLFHYMEELRYKMGFKVAPISYCSWQGRVRKGINNYQTITELIKNQNFIQIFNHLDEYIDGKIPIEHQNNALNNYNGVSRNFKNDQLQITPFFVGEQGETITNYIIEPGALPGRILNEKLKEFGIKGKQINQISTIGSITINGKVIKIQQVREPSAPSPNVILLHYKQTSTITQILKNTTLSQFLSNKNNQIYAIFHIIQDHNTVLSPEFKLLLSSFSNTTQHIVYNRKFKNSTDSLEDLISLSSQVKLVSTLNKYFPLCMPNLIEKHLKYVSEYVGKTQCIDLLFPEFKVKAYKRCHELVVAPKKSWGYKSVNHADKKNNQIILNCQVPQQIQNLQLPEQFKNKFQKIDPKVVFLGTGSMKPSKYRNVSSILVEWTPKDFIMFDCGQGSHIQIADHYGYQRYQDVLLGIRTIFITHIHSDHNLGILDLISQRTKIIKQRGINIQNSKLFLVLPANVVPWYNSFCQNIENLNEGCQVIFIQTLRAQDYSFEGTMSKQNMAQRKCSSQSQMVDQKQQQEQQSQDQLNFIRPQWTGILKQYYQQQQQTLKKFYQYLNLLSIDQFFPCPVIHCPQSYGIIIRHISGVKVSYSGDTRPCKQFAKAAQQSTILIHEATFGDDLASNAQTHFHSTVGQAIDIGIQSQSWKLALTHFSQRYKSASEIVDPRIYKLNQNKRAFAHDHTIVCFDHLQMHLSQTHLMPAYSRAIAAAIPGESKE